MDPLSLYVLLFAGALIVCLLASTVWRPPSRACPSCGDETPVQARRCRNCGYAPAGA
jgi:predicted amidophosphoribosyltransferase